MEKGKPGAAKALVPDSAAKPVAKPEKIGSDNPNAKAVIPEFVRDGQRALEAVTKDMDADIAATVVAQDKESLRTALLMQICRNTKKGK